MGRTTTNEPPMSERCAMRGSRMAQNERGSSRCRSLGEPNCRYENGRTTSRMTSARTLAAISSIKRPYLHRAEHAVRAGVRAAPRRLWRQRGRALARDYSACGICGTARAPSKCVEIEGARPT